MNFSVNVFLIFVYIFILSGNAEEITIGFPFSSKYSTLVLLGMFKRSLIVCFISSDGVPGYTTKF